MIRFSLVLTNDVGLTKWEIHAADCPDVVTMIREGKFVEMFSAPSAAQFVKTELMVSKASRSEDDPYKIMPCCAQESTAA